MKETLEEDSLLIVLTYAPAGLGHLRVTDALYHGLSENTKPVLFGSRDETIKKIHRYTSIHPWARKIYEWMQDGPFSFFFIRIYKAYLSKNTKILYRELTAILEGSKASKILFVATHFGLAHQIVSLRQRIEGERGVRIFVAVSVTDDYAHPMWYVEGANVITVPSKKTKEKFLKIRQDFMFKEVRIEVLPYPLSPFLTSPLSPAEAKNRFEQLLGSLNVPIHISIPVSGAAVGLTYYSELISELLNLSQRFIFHIVSRQALYTEGFLRRFSGNSRVKIYSSKVDSEVVDFYDNLFLSQTISLEITKPSEHAFKALLDSNKKGGVLLLFTQAFGFQELSNLEFLKRHYLIPEEDTQKLIWEMGEVSEKLKNDACGWRGLKLPDSPKAAAQFIGWCLRAGIFSQMLLCRGDPKEIDPEPGELSKNGVQKFWELAYGLINTP